MVGKVAEHVLFDMRRAMMARLQRVSLSFMDKTEVGRLMSRLQGDVNSMQEFLETSVMSVGDIVLLFGIVGVLLYLDVRLGLLTLATMPTLLVIRFFWLPPAKRSFMAAHETNSIANGALAEGINGVRTVQSLNRQRVNFDLYDEKAHANLTTHLRAAKFAQVTVPIVDTLTGISMATVIVVGGQMVLNHDARSGRDGGVPVLHPALLRSDPLADHAVFGDAARHGVGPADLRSARCAGRHRRQARRDAAAGRHGRLGRVQACDLRLPARTSRCSRM